MVNLAKKFAVLAIAMSLAVAPVASMAATKSPSGGKTEATTETKPEYVRKESGVSSNGSAFATYKTGKASLKSFKTSKKSASVPKTIKYKGKTYKICYIRKYAFKKSKKLVTLTVGSNVVKINTSAFSSSKIKTVKFNTKKVPDIRKGAFKKSKVKTIKITKKMSAKNFKKFKKLLKKVGFKGTIKRY